MTATTGNLTLKDIKTGQLRLILSFDQINLWLV